MRIFFDAPDAPARASIFARYARQLSEGQLQRLAEGAEGLSGRDILDVCKQTERRWASKLLRASGGLGPSNAAHGNGQRDEDESRRLPTLPPLSEYEVAVQRRLPDAGR